MSGETRRPWSQQEDEAIRVIVRQLGTKHWSQISQVMQEKHKLYGRSGKQCRQRWHNHLAPEVNKTPWSKNQQQILFEAHKKFGNKWTQISKLIEGRTDNAIKNHFYSSIRRSLRRINKILGSKNSTVKMRNVKPAVLSAIFNLADKEDETNSHHYKDLTFALIEFSRSRVKKQKPIAEEQKSDLQNLIKKLMQFNDIYEKDKKDSKRSSINSDFSRGSLRNHNKKVENEQQYDDQQQQFSQSLRNQGEIKSQPSIMNHNVEQIQENTRNGRINLEQSEYDWEQFQQRCQTIVNRYMLSQNSIKSMENLPNQQIHQSTISESFKSNKTPTKEQKQSSCSSNDVVFSDPIHKTQ